MTSRYSPPRPLAEGVFLELQARKERQSPEEGRRKWTSASICRPQRWMDRPLGGNEQNSMDRPRGRDLPKKKNLRCFGTERGIVMGTWEKGKHFEIKEKVQVGDPVTMSCWRSGGRRSGFLSKVRRTERRFSRFGPFVLLRVALAMARGREGDEDEMEFPFPPSRRRESLLKIAFSAKWRGMKRRFAFRLLSSSFPLPLLVWRGGGVKGIRSPPSLGPSLGVSW